MNTHAIWKEDKSRPVFIEVAEPEDYNLGMPEYRYVFLRTVVPFTQESLEVGTLRRTAARIYKLASEVFPFLEYHTVKIYPDFREGDNTDREEFSEVYGFVTPEIIPDNLRVYQGEGVGVQTPFSNLYSASNNSFPALGSFGYTVAALESAGRYCVSLTQQSTKLLQDLWRIKERDREGEAH